MFVKIYLNSEFFKDLQISPDSEKMLQTYYYYFIDFIKDLGRLLCSREIFRGLKIVLCNKEVRDSDILQKEIFHRCTSSFKMFPNFVPFVPITRSLTQ